MPKKRYVMIIAITLALMTTACDNNAEKKANSNGTSGDVKEEQNDSKESEDKKGNTKDPSTEGFALEEFPAIPTDVDDLANQTSGPFANAENLWDMEDEIDEKMQKLGEMSESPSDDEYTKYSRYIYSLLAQDYPNPDDMVKKWEFASFGNPDLPDSKFHFKENYNVEIILDSSGSMGFASNNGTRMEVAKDSINRFLSEVPEEANVSLRVYGHEGTGDDSDKEMSCDSIEQVYGFESYDEGEFQNALDQFQPSGWTPLADALDKSQEALNEFDAENHTNLIYVVSDGIETCDGDPVKVAESLSDSNAQPIINIIGFQTDAEAQKQLEEMADVSNGIFTSAQNEEDLQEEFDRAEEILKAWEDWKSDAMKDLDAAKVDNTFDIMAFHNDWSSITQSMENEMDRFTNIAENLGYFTLDQKKLLQEKMESKMEEIAQAGDQLERDLEELSKQKIEEAKTSVEEKYNKHTEN